jgi:hypothetical protein
MSNMTIVSFPTIVSLANVYVHNIFFFKYVTHSVFFNYNLIPCDRFALEKIG